METTCKRSVHEGRNYVEILRELRRDGYGLVALGAQGLGAVETSLIGGVCERVLHQDLCLVADHASHHGMSVVVGTNGTLLTGELAHRLVDSGVKGVGISLDSAVPERHDAFWGLPGAWRGAVQAMGACREVGLPFLVQSTITPSNYPEVPALVLLTEAQTRYLGIMWGAPAAPPTSGGSPRKGGPCSWAAPAAWAGPAIAASPLRVR